MKKITFDYESKLWGSSDVRILPYYLGALRLKYCLDSLKAVNGSILEIGCGAGGMSKAIKYYRPDLHVLGIDISKKAILEAKKNSQGVEFKIGNAYDLPFEKNYFDSVVIFDVLEHMQYPGRVLEEVHRVLKMGGVLYAFIPMEGEILTLHGLLYTLGWRAKVETIGHIQQFTLPQIRKMYKANGFFIVDVKWIGHLVNQLVDVSYFSWLTFSGRKVPLSVEGYIQKKKQNSLTKMLAAGKNIFAMLSWIESMILSRFTGSGTSIVAKKL